jgi:hypothetical protein
MSFLKQLLTPFVEFDEEKKKEAAKKRLPVINGCCAICSAATHNTSCAAC